jgi:hypothetical protein
MSLSFRAIIILKSLIAYYMALTTLPALMHFVQTFNARVESL